MGIVSDMSTRNMSLPSIMGDEFPKRNAWLGKLMQMTNDEFALEVNLFMQIYCIVPPALIIQGTTEISRFIKITIFKLTVFDQLADQCQLRKRAGMLWGLWKLRGRKELKELDKIIQIKKEEWTLFLQDLRECNGAVEK